MSRLPLSEPCAVAHAVSKHRSCSTDERLYGCTADERLYTLCGVGGVDILTNVLLLLLRLQADDDDDA